MHCAHELVNRLVVFGFLQTYFSAQPDICVVDVVARGSDALCPLSVLYEEKAALAYFRHLGCPLLQKNTPIDTTKQVSRRSMRVDFVNGTRQKEFVTGPSCAVAVAC